MNINWVIIVWYTKHIKDFSSHPRKILSSCEHYLNNPIILSFSQASKKPKSFWKDKVVVFRMRWDKSKDVLKLTKKARNYSSMFWICPSSVDFFTNPNKINLFNDTNNPFKELLLKYTKYIIWEPPMNFNPLGECVRVQMRSYPKHRESEIPINKKYDALGFIDTYKYNDIKTLKILKSLKKKGYKVICVVANSKRKIYDKFGIKLIVNKKPGGDFKWRKLLKKSKVLIDINKRITVGRTIYNALTFGGCLSVCTNTYASSHMIFREYMINPHNRVYKILRVCKKAIKKWSIKTVKKYRRRAKRKATPKIFYKKLEEKTNEILC